MNETKTLIDGELCWFELIQKGESFWCVTDKCNANLVASSRWHICKKGVQRDADGKLLHRLILEVNKSDCVIHESGNKWDCREENLLKISRSDLTKDSGVSYRMYDQYGNVVGVTRQLKKMKGKMYAFWVATIGSKHKKCFSVKKWGERGAAEQAVKFRLNTLAEIDARMFIPSGFPSDYDELAPMKFYAA